MNRSSADKRGAGSAIKQTESATVMLLEVNAFSRLIKSHPIPKPRYYENFFVRSSNKFQIEFFRFSAYIQDLVVTLLYSPPFKASYAREEKREVLRFTMIQRDGHFIIA